MPNGCIHVHVATKNHHRVYDFFYLFIYLFILFIIIIIIIIFHRERGGVVVERRTPTLTPYSTGKTQEELALSRHD